MKIIRLTSATLTPKSIAHQDKTNNERISNLKLANKFVITFGMLKYLNV